jgi:hypothetical protein
MLHVDVLDAILHAMKQHRNNVRFQTSACLALQRLIQIYEIVHVDGDDDPDWEPWDRNAMSDESELAIRWVECFKAVTRALNDCHNRSDGWPAEGCASLGLLYVCSLRMDSSVWEASRP